MKETIIFGLGREGMSSYQHLRSQDAEQTFLLIDDKPQEELTPEWQEILATDKLARFLSSSVITAENLSGSLLIKTPGIPPTHPVYIQAQSLQLKTTSNTQLFFEFLQSKAPETITIGITGTKGKSTTTALIHHVLNTNDLPALLAGNIGEPALNLVPQVGELAKSGKTPIVVLELSSHQLLDLTHSPNIAVILNITPEHLDYYPSVAEYTQAKSAICRFQSQDDIVIYDPAKQAAQALATKSPAQQLFFTDLGETEPSQEFAASLVQDILFAGTTQVNSATKLPLVGRHQWINALPSIVIGAHFGIAPQQIAQSLQSFRPLPHRLELVGEHNGVRYYNDSQATTPEAAIAALRSFPVGTVALIAGGSEKGVDLTEFAQEILRQKVQTIALFPPTGEKILELLRTEPKKIDQPLPKYKIVSSMSEAVDFVTTDLHPDMTVLLSPACASFGFFKNYQDRGEQFRQMIQTDIIGK